MNNIFGETIQLMRKYNIKANRNLGQNFLIDESIINKIVDSASIEKEDLVIEIGPGLGTLTNLLLQKAKKVIAIELDSRMAYILNEQFKEYHNLMVINNDILKENLRKLIKKEKECNNIKKVKIVANLPYYITTPIIMKLLEDNLDIESITVMIQKEVADRLITTPGNKETGAITYTVYYYCTSEKIIEVPNTSFIPKPEVTSEVIKLTLRKELPVKVEDKKVLFMIIKSAFLQRRKTLLNALTNSKVFLNKEEGTEILNKLDINVDIRAEKLTLDEFARLTEEIIQRSKKEMKIEC